MVMFLLVIIVILVVILVFQFNRKNTIESNIRYISAQLNDILERNHPEKLLLVTDHPLLSQLLIEMNRILDQQQQASVYFARKERSLKKMLANISHDIKTPLTVVLGYIEVINEDPTMTDEENIRMLSQLHDKTMEVIKLLNAFFDLAKLEAGDQEFPLSRVHINEVCKSTLLVFYDLIQTEKLEVITDLTAEPMYALANKEALDRVLTNLLSNAIRYGKDGHVVGLTVTGDDDHVHIEVWDQGQGIDARDQAHVFERLYTLTESRNKSFQGSGLGLTITKKLTEAMAGTITLHSIPHQKTTFTVRLERINY